MKHRELQVLLPLVLALGGSLAGEPLMYDIRPAGNARLELVVEKTGLYKGKKHVFTFDRYSGTMTFDPASPEKSSVNLAIEAGSIVCHDTWVSMKDLRKIMEEATKNMLGAERFPTISFQSTNVMKSSAGAFEVQGLLTIRGIAKPASLTVTRTNAAEPSLTFRGESVVRLTDFGLKPPTAVFGAIGTKNEMDFAFTVVAGPPKN